MKTSVEWLEEMFNNSEIPNSSMLFKQAKEMEKQRMIDFADKYGTYLLQGGTMSATTYNETFKSE
jgi:hypothetical protein